MDRLRRVTTNLLAQIALLAIASLAAIGQTAPSAPSAQTVEGQVQRVYSSDDKVRLVELRLTSNAPRQRYREPSGARLPAAGNVVYVTLNQVGMNSGQQRTPQLPEVGESIRARLSPSDHGTWTAAGNWYTVLRPSQDGHVDDSSLGRTPSTVDAYGMTCKAVLAGGRLGLQVQKVANSGSAQAAGLQPGDVIVGINHRPLSSAADLRHAESNDGSIALIVIDVNSGRVASVDLPVDRSAAKPGHETDDTPDESQVAAERIQTALGLVLEEPDDAVEGVTVQRAQEGSGAALAGIEPGDVIVGVGNQQVSSAVELAKAVPDAARRLTVVVRDIRSGRDVPVEVKSAGVAQSTKLGRTPAAGSGSASGGLGIHGELTFYNAEAAVKVARVDRDSPAARAGIREGMILLSANGDALLHPNDLENAVKQSRGPIAFRLVDLSGRREISITVNR
ncbi:PDZ domain-containing protein [Aeoliella sp. ICT_H6.2]|uniref:PDZ domain-containing protein n=1 Tax=Aeoliella straminimaris TaxID=2954799 RepID=A0A9X2JHX9_9BACT|nr:PDZ domain-containing protein [Aeoliella straminimaris]MCO6046286.1 PDZ domain-containing protein [Aeoliella straminimaris]